MQTKITYPIKKNIWLSVNCLTVSALVTCSLYELYLCLSLKLHLYEITESQEKTLPRLADHHGSRSCFSFIFTSPTTRLCCCFTCLYGREVKVINSEPLSESVHRILFSSFILQPVKAIFLPSQGFH